MNKKNILVVAPHLTFPLRNGADVYIVKKWSAFSKTGCKVIFLAADGLYVSENGDVTSIEKWKDTRASQFFAMLKFLFQGVDYISARFVTSIYISKIKYLASFDFDFVVFSFPSVYVKLKGKVSADCYVVETHNFEPKLYRERADELSGFKRVIAKINAVRAEKILDDIDKDVPIIALGDDDFLCYSKLGFINTVLSVIGYEFSGSRAFYPSGDKCILSFVGSLSAVMNTAAIERFVNNEYQKLKDILSGNIELRIIGSNPIPSVVDLNNKLGVTVYANVSDDELGKLVQTSHAVIFPFENDNGQKLKFSTAISLGVPVLSYISKPSGLNVGAGVFNERDMCVWAREIKEFMGDPGLYKGISDELADFAESHSWENVVAHEFAELESMVRV